jgi:hypothetical protein
MSVRQMFFGQKAQDIEEKQANPISQRFYLLRSVEENVETELTLIESSLNSFFLEKKV